MKPGDVWQQRAGYGPKLNRKGGADAASAAAAPLPCLNSNISTALPLTEGQKSLLNKLSTSHKKTAYALGNNVKRLCDTYGIENLAFFTSTFADHVTCAKEAGRRFNSLNTHVLSKRYRETITVLERQKSGRIHFHTLAVMSCDIRSGFNFTEAKDGKYSSANSALRAEWAFWRKTAPQYGFGRTELLPVKSNEEGVSRYVGKYIEKHIEQREDRDKGVRLVRYSSGANYCGTKFQFVSARSRLWRWQLERFAQLNGAETFDDLAAMFGPKWAYEKRRDIMAIPPPKSLNFSRKLKDGSVLVEQLHELFTNDRIALAVAFAAANGVDVVQAHCHLYGPSEVSSGRRMVYGLDLAPITWTPTPKVDCPVDVVTYWNDSD